MSYRFYLGNIQLPVAPARVEIKYGDRLKRLDLANGREIVFPKTRGLAEISFSALLPQVKYPFAVYQKGFRSGGRLLGDLLQMKNSRKPFRFIVLRKVRKGKSRPSTNINVVVKEIVSREDAGEGSDIYVDVRLVEYRDFAVQKLKVKPVSSSSKTAVKKSTVRPANTKPAVKKYKVVKGDSLWMIAHRFLGNGNRYKEIYNLNKTLIDGRNKGTGLPVYTIYAGQEFKLP